MNFAIIGCGLIGQKRAAALGQHPLLVVCDTNLAKANALAANHPGCQSVADYRDVIANPKIDAVIIATLHASLAEIALAAITAGKHILLEKPGARRASELENLIAAAESKQICARVGFNHRYHRAFRKARELVDANELGELMFIRARYGHGGRLDYHKEWRASPALSGGGELIDQGVHLIDLARYFLGEFADVHGFATTYFWDMPVDDNGFMLLKTSRQQVAHLHASCTEWKNTFSFELYGKGGKLDINGLGGSYGTERLAFYKMLPQMGPPETMIWEYPMSDDSFAFEVQEFIADIKTKRQPRASLHDAKAALEIVETVYRMSNL